MKGVSIIIAAFVLVACNSNKDPKFCECLKAGELLNDEVARYGTIALDKITNEDVVTLKKLKGNKEKACKPYQLMSGEEMLKKKEACK